MEQLPGFIKVKNDNYAAYLEEGITLWPFREDIESEKAQLFKILIERLPVRVDIILAQFWYDLPDRQTVILIRVCHEYLHQIQKL